MGRLRSTPTADSYRLAKISTHAPAPQPTSSTRPDILTASSHGPIVLSSLLNRYATAPGVDCAHAPSCSSPREPYHPRRRNSARQLRRLSGFPEPVHRPWPLSLPPFALFPSIVHQSGIASRMYKSLLPQANGKSALIVGSHYESWTIRS